MKWYIGRARWNKVFRWSVAKAKVRWYRIVEWIGMRSVQRSHAHQPPSLGLIAMTYKWLLVLSSVVARFLHFLSVFHISHSSFQIIQSNSPRQICGICRLEKCVVRIYRWSYALENLEIFYSYLCTVGMSFKLVNYSVRMVRLHWLWTVPTRAEEISTRDHRKVLRTPNIGCRKTGTWTHASGLHFAQPKLLTIDLRIFSIAFSLAHSYSH